MNGSWRKNCLVFGPQRRTNERRLKADMLSEKINKQIK